MSSHDTHQQTFRAFDETLGRWLVAHSEKELSEVANSPLMVLWREMRKADQERNAGYQSRHGQHQMLKARIKRYRKNAKRLHDTYGRDRLKTPYTPPQGQQLSA